MVGFLHVALHRGDAHAEGAGRLALEDPTSYGRDYLLSKIFGITIHAVMLSSVHLCCNVLYIANTALRRSLLSVVKASGRGRGAILLQPSPVARHSQAILGPLLGRHPGYVPGQHT